ncbi:MAG: hypothetical protein JNL60_03830 [Bacteroidia bacterium]|nr:hypothetical protein [Bacteroidia bacterium]
MKPKKERRSETKDPTETDLQPERKRLGSRENADHTGTDANSDFTESEEQKSKRPSRFDKNKREVDPDMTEPTE